MQPHAALSHLQKLKPTVLTIALLASFLVLCAVGLVSGTAQSAQDDAKDERKFENTIPAHVPLKVKVKNEQSFKNLKNKNWALIVEVIAQNDNPLRIMVIDIDNSALSVQKVNYTIQNIDNKPVKGYVIWAKGKNTGKITTNFFPTKSFQPGAVDTEELFLEREGIKPDEILSLSIDYVEFEDGSSWGEDLQGQSEHLIGARAGVEAAVKEFRNLINSRETAALTAILEKNLVDVDVSLPKTVQNEKWQKGFTDGYKAIVGFLKNQRGQGHNELLKKLSEIENLQTEGRQKH